ncbi:MAG: 4'-phosphopantetheinyl transferase superfamily protein [Ruminococcaceae bacterium]|nr:4'-phosphopantetheinyl transferase superfamily protein [Oscillospiraceae bacterium]
MILLSCAKLPAGINKKDIAELVRAKLSNNANDEYISALEQKSNELSACESLFALNLLCDMIPQLPQKTDTSALILARGECGKPYFWSSTLKFNLSHSQGCVACAVSDSDEVGVDIEAALPTDDRAKKLAERFFDDTDKKAVEEDPTVFTRLWSEKEAKAKFFGISLAEFLTNEKKTESNSKKMQGTPNISLHRFSFCNIPVTLCTKRDFSTIIFTYTT